MPPTLGLYPTQNIFIFQICAKFHTQKKMAGRIQYLILHPLCPCEELSILQQITDAFKPLKDKNNSKQQPLSFKGIHGYG